MQLIHIILTQCLPVLLYLVHTLDCRLSVTPQRLVAGKHAHHRPCFPLRMADVTAVLPGVFGKACQHFQTLVTDQLLGNELYIKTHTHKDNHCMFPL